MIRFWAFAAFVMLLAVRKPGGIRGAFVTKHPLMQMMRGVLLVAEIALASWPGAYRACDHPVRIFQSTPLIVTILSILLLGEHVGWRRWLAVVAGLFAFADHQSGPVAGSTPIFSCRLPARPCSRSTAWRQGRQAATI